MAHDSPDFIAILRLLCADGVEFVVVGAVAAALQGAPIVTLDLDIVHRRSAKNIDRLLTVLRALNAVYRDPAGRRLTPRAEALASTGHHLLSTRAGPLDVLGAIEGGRAYENLIKRSRVIRLEADLSVRALRLDALVELKEGSNREKDRAVLPTLRRTLEESKRKRK